jgi:thioredoxin reductase
MVETWPEPDGSIGLELANGAVVRAHAMIGAMGSQYRRLEAAGLDELIGSGVYYGSARSDVAFHRNGDVFIVGGANSAGQGAILAAEFARSVTLLIRGPSLEEGMSTYLIDRCNRHPKIRVRTNARITRVLGKGRLGGSARGHGHRPGRGAARGRAVHPDRRRAHLFVRPRLAATGRARVPDHGP